MSDQPPPPPPPPSGGFPPPPPPPPGGGFGTPPPAGYTQYSAAPPGAGPGISAPLGGVGARFGGLLIDGLITGAFFIPAWVVLISGPKHLTECTVNASGDITSLGGEANALCNTPTSATVGLAILLGLLALVGMLVYQGKLAGGPSGQTVGMRAVGVKVIDANTGGPIGAGRAIGRYLFAYFISSLLCALGYLWALWDPKKQTWHDKVTTSIVIKT